MIIRSYLCGSSSVVERQLPKLNVESSNLFSRSLEIAPIRAIFLFWDNFVNFHIKSKLLAYYFIKAIFRDIL